MPTAFSGEAHADRIIDNTAREVEGISSGWFGSDESEDSSKFQISMSTKRNKSNSKSKIEEKSVAPTVPSQRRRPWYRRRPSNLINIDDEKVGSRDSDEGALVAASIVDGINDGYSNEIGDTINTLHKNDDVAIEPVEPISGENELRYDSDSIEASTQPIESKSRSVRSDSVGGFSMESFGSMEGSEIADDILPGSDKYSDEYFDSIDKMRKHHEVKIEPVEPISMERNHRNRNGRRSRQSRKSPGLINVSGKSDSSKEGRQVAERVMKGLDRYSNEIFDDSIDRIRKHPNVKIEPIEPISEENRRRNRNDRRSRHSRRKSDLIDLDGKSDSSQEGRKVAERVMKGLDKYSKEIFDDSIDRITKYPDVKIEPIEPISEENRRRNNRRQSRRKLGLLNVSDRSNSSPEGKKVADRIMKGLNKFSFDGDNDSIDRIRKHPNVKIEPVQPISFERSRRYRNRNDRRSRHSRRKPDLIDLDGSSDTSQDGKRAARQVMKGLDKYSKEILDDSIDRIRKHSNVKIEPVQPISFERSRRYRNRNDRRSRHSRRKPDLIDLDGKSDSSQEGRKVAERVMKGLDKYSKEILDDSIDRIRKHPNVKIEPIEPISMERNDRYKNDRRSRRRKASLIDVEQKPISSKEGSKVAKQVMKGLNKYSFDGDNDSIDRIRKHPNVKIEPVQPISFERSRRYRNRNDRRSRHSRRKPDLIDLDRKSDSSQEGRKVAESVMKGLDRYSNDISDSVDHIEENEDIKLEPIEPISGEESISIDDGLSEISEPRSFHRPKKAPGLINVDRKPASSKEGSKVAKQVMKNLGKDDEREDTSDSIDRIRMHPNVKIEPIQPISVERSRRYRKERRSRRPARKNRKPVRKSSISFSSAEGLKVANSMIDKIDSFSHEIDDSIDRLKDDFDLPLDSNSDFDIDSHDSNRRRYRKGDRKSPSKSKYRQKASKRTGGRDPDSPLGAIGLDSAKETKKTSKASEKQESTNNVGNVQSPGSSNDKPSSDGNDPRSRRVSNKQDIFIDKKHQVVVVAKAPKSSKQVEKVIDEMFEGMDKKGNDVGQSISDSIDRLEKHDDVGFVPIGGSGTKDLFKKSQKEVDQVGKDDKKKSKKKEDIFDEKHMKADPNGDTSSMLDKWQEMEKTSDKVSKTIKNTVDRAVGKLDTEFEKVAKPDKESNRKRKSIGRKRDSLAFSESFQVFDDVSLSTVAKHGKKFPKKSNRRFDPRSSDFEPGNKKRGRPFNNGKKDYPKLSWENDHWIEDTIRSIPNVHSSEATPKFDGFTDDFPKSKEYGLDFDNVFTDWKQRADMVDEVVFDDGKQTETSIGDSFAEEAIFDQTAKMVDRYFRNRDSESCDDIDAFFKNKKNSKKKLVRRTRNVDPNEVDELVKKNAKKVMESVREVMALKKSVPLTEALQAGPENASTGSTDKDNFENFSNSFDFKASDGDMVDIESFEYLDQKNQKESSNVEKDAENDEEIASYESYETSPMNSDENEDEDEDEEEGDYCEDGDEYYEYNDEEMWDSHKDINGPANLPAGTSAFPAFDDVVDKYGMTKLGSVKPDETVVILGDNIKVIGTKQ